jgi:PAS domain S-box
VIHKGVEIPYEKGKSRLWASTDITKLKKREKELEETKNYLEAVRSSVSEMLYTFNIDSVTTYINPAFTKITGFTKEDMIGKSIDEWPALPPDTKPLIAARVKQRAKTGEPITNVETELITKGGKRFPIRYSASGIRDEKGSAIGEVVVATDVTELKKREREIRAAKAYTEAIIDKHLRSSLGNG